MKADRPSGVTLSVGVPESHLPHPGQPRDAQQRDTVSGAYSQPRPDAGWRAHRGVEQFACRVEGQEPGNARVWPDGEPDFGRLDELFDLLAAEESEWKQFFKRNEYEPLTVVYEEYTCNVQSFGSTVREILHFVGIGVPDGFTPPEPGQKQQSDEVTEEIVQRYRARRASLDTSTMG
jgi:LPS sulfotransferase NodH